MAAQSAEKTAVRLAALTAGSTVDEWVFEMAVDWAGQTVVSMAGQTAACLDATSAGGRAAMWALREAGS